MEGEIRPSASVIPWRNRGSGLEVFWVQRSMSVSFLPGWHAFPGGAVDEDDAAIGVTGFPQGLSTERTEWPPPSGVVGTVPLPPDGIPGLTAAALRELFEEIGVLVSVSPVKGDLAPAQRELLSGRSSFAEVLLNLGARLDASSLIFAGRWQTPPFSPVRFDNRFFLLEWTADGRPQPRVVPGELSAGEWISPADAVDRWRRGDALLAPPNLHILEALSRADPRDAVETLRRPTNVDFGPYRRIELVPGVLLFPLPVPGLPPATHTNGYLVGYGQCVLVDPATAGENDRDLLLAALMSIRENLGRSVSAIWLTHHHRDHVAGVDDLRKALGAPVLAHPATAERLDFPVDDLLLEGTTLRLEGNPPLTVEVLHTPGHDPGHLSFFLPESRSVLVGDMASALSTVVIDPPEGNMADYLESLESLRRLAPRVVLPGHGPPLYPGRDRLEELLGHRRWRERLVHEAWSRGQHDLDQLVRAVYQGTPRSLWALAKRQVEAHLLHLRQQKLI